VPRSPEQVAALVRGALRDFEANAVKRADAHPPAEPV
jgi:hypothetical protein